MPEHAHNRSFTSTIRRGVVKRWSQTLIPTTREAPAEASVVSHILLTRAGFIRQVGAGVYDYLPLAWRSLMKISDIVREEMEAAGGSEMLMPVLEPMELFKDTKRDVAYGELLFRLEDRHGRSCALGPTHEEVITELLRTNVASYKALPLTLYQIQTKFRDEFRPRGGLLRCREFIMKDAYSFSLAVDGPGGLNEAYDKQYQAYVNIFTRCGLDFSIVEAESGPIGGSASHEFMVNAESGEDTILRCPVSGYAANVEKCEIGKREWSFAGEPGGSLTTNHTPGMPGIDSVAEHLGVTPAQMLKTLVFRQVGTGGTSGVPPRWILACVRGDHDANEGKIRDAAGVGVELAPEKEARSAGFAIGYVSPRAALAIENCTLLVDPDAAKGSIAWATGSDKPDHHDTNFNWTRDLAGEPASVAKVADIRNAMAGDPSPRADATLETGRGIEVGHIFKLGTKYSDAMGFAIMDREQKRQPVIMGCYGIGVSRTLAAAVEQNHDDNGIIWPAPIAPYHAHIVVMKPGDERHASTTETLSHALADAGLDVLIDDRDERSGVKFNDADLIGLPIRITIGDKALDQGGVELKMRRDAGKGEVVSLAGVADRCIALLASLA